jgi:hypothetical protein
MRFTIQQRFEQFHLDNPWAYATLAQMIEELRAKGVERWGMKSLWEVLRWRIAIGQVRVVGDADFKLNNDYTSRYARLLVQNNPEWANMFELRELRAR